MLARALVMLGFVGAFACTPLPEVSFVGDDAASPSTLDGAAPTFDATTDGAASDSTALDASDDSSPVGSVDANGQDAPTSDADSSTCPPIGAPAGTGCCPDGTPCIGPACSHCNACNCAVGLYCCANENGGGKFQSTNCSNAPTGSSCPTK